MLKLDYRDDFQVIKEVIENGIGGSIVCLEDKQLMKNLRTAEVENCVSRFLRTQRPALDISNLPGFIMKEEDIFLILMSYRSIPDIVFTDISRYIYNKYFLSLDLSEGTDSLIKLEHNHEFISMCKLVIHLIK